MLERNQYSYYLNYNVGISPITPGTFSRITTFKFLKDNLSTLTSIRYMNLPPEAGIKDGGWHFSWMGGSKKIVEKLESWAHQEFNKERFKNPESIDYFINSGKEHLGRIGIGETIPVEIDSTFPEYIQTHQKELIEKGLINPISTPRVAIIMPYFNDKTLTLARVHAAQAKGLKVQLWTPYYDAEVLKSYNMHPDFIQTDHTNVQANLFK